MITPDRTQLLVVGDESTLGESSFDVQVARNFDVRTVPIGEFLPKRQAYTEADAVVIDIASLHNQGVEHLREIREHHPSAAILVITASGQERERMFSLEAGADDFLLKPFTMEELDARIHAIKYRARSSGTTTLRFGPVSMNLTTRKVSNGEKQISLTPTEFRILELLMRHQGNVVTRKMLCEYLWDPEWEGLTNVIEVHINRLRSKLSLGSEDRMIHTVRGSGYTLKLPSEHYAERRSVVER